jgi:predicted nuclease of predicted toxin-antitoxin system
LKLLFDQNISPRIISQLSDEFKDSKQVRELGLENSSDLNIFLFAKSNDYSIVTFDSDFVDLSVLKGTPPKIIWFKTGNLTTKSIAQLLTSNLELINDFLSQELTFSGILEIIK